MNVRVLTLSNMAVGRKLASAPWLSIKERLIAVLPIKMQVSKRSYESARLYTRLIKIKVIRNKKSSKLTQDSAVWKTLSPLAKYQRDCLEILFDLMEKLFECFPPGIRLGSLLWEFGVLPMPFCIVKYLAPLTPIKIFLLTLEPNLTAIHPIVISVSQS